VADPVLTRLRARAAREERREALIKRDQILRVLAPLHLVLLVLVSSSAHNDNDGTHGREEGHVRPAAKDVRKLPHCGA
jgi:hypothetical protein